MAQKWHSGASDTQNGPCYTISVPKWIQKAEFNGIGVLTEQTCSSGIAYGNTAAFYNMGEEVSTCLRKEKNPK